MLPYNAECRRLCASAKVVISDGYASCLKASLLCCRRVVSQKLLTFTQTVPGSNPGALTNKINWLSFQFSFFRELSCFR
jgi:hypothetical protein